MNGWGIKNEKWKDAWWMKGWMRNEKMNGWGMKGWTDEE